MDQAKLVSTDGEFSLYAVSPIYKTYVISEGGYIRNTKTGENCGQKVELRERWYEGATKPVPDEDCYEFVYGSEQ